MRLLIFGQFLFLGRLQQIRFYLFQLQAILPTRQSYFCSYLPFAYKYAENPNLNQVHFLFALFFPAAVRILVSIFQIQFWRLSDAQGLGSRSTEKRDFLGHTSNT